jgi:hypothetical protein
MSKYLTCIYTGKTINLTGGTVMKTRLKPMKAGSIIDNTFSILRERFWVFQGVNALSLLPVFIFGGITLAIMFMVLGMNQLDNLDDLFTKNGMNSIYLALLILVDIIAYVIGLIYMAYGNIKLFRDGLHNEKTPFKEVFQGIRGKRWRYFSVYFLFFLAYLPLYIGAFFVMEASPILGILLMFLVMGIVFAIIFCFCLAPVIVFLEDKGTLASIKRAFQLMARYRWTVFGTLLLVYLLWYFMFWGFYIFAILAFLLTLVKHIAAYVGAGLLGIVGLLVLSILMSYFYGPLTAMYYNLLIRKEGYDIQLQLAEEAQTVPAINDDRGTSI